MREIKFRGKFTSENQLIPHPNEGGWVYGDLVHKAIFHCGKYTDAIYECGNAIPVDSDTVGQFTGLRDRNGREIYEGDVVRFVDDECTDIGCVVYSESYAKFVVVYSEVSGNWFDFEGTCSEIICLTSEIVGNVYENSDLLK